MSSTGKGAGRPKRKLWSVESMEGAVKSVREGMALREAARQYNVPVETLRRRVLGKVDIVCKPGPPTVLTFEEEQKLSEYVIKMADMGFGLSREDLRITAFRIESLSGRPHPFTNGMAGTAWLEGFFARHPTLVLRTVQPLSYSRAVSANRETIQDYFAKLASIYARLNILAKPMQIFNIDEVGVSIVHKPGKVITEIGRKCVWSLTSAERGKNHTILACVSAAGFSLPPFMIYPRKRITDSIKEGAYPGTSFNCNESGWVTQELYIEWFYFFLKNIPPTWPVLLIEVGHSSHVSMDVIELAQKNDVHLLCLPSHSTHLLQPLDVGFFKPLKSYYSKECKRYLAAHAGQVITPQMIASLVGKAWLLAFTPVNIMAGFRKSGSYPLNPGVIDDRQVAPSCATNPDCLSVESSPDSQSSASLSPGSNFTPEQEVLFSKRYEENYDLPDSVYSQWLAIKHPETARSSASIETHISDITTPSSTSGTASDVLSEVLKLPEPKNPRRRRKVGFNTGKAVTISNDSFLQELKDKDEKKAKEEKEAKKIERQKRKKKKQKAQEAAKKQKRQRAKRGKGCKKQLTVTELAEEFVDLHVSQDSETGSSDVSDAQCPLCGLTYQGDDSGLVWLYCDGCDVLVDFKCSGLKNPKRLPKYYYCPSCK